MRSVYRVYIRSRRISAIKSMKDSGEALGWIRIPFSNHAVVPWQSLHRGHVLGVLPGVASVALKLVGSTLGSFY